MEERAKSGGKKTLCNRKELLGKEKLEQNIRSEITVIRQENKMFLHKKKNSSNIIIACLSCCELKLTSSADEPPEENWIGDNEETSQKTLICLFKQEYIAKSR